MPIQYRLKVSSTQLQLLWFTHLAVFAVVAIYLESPWLKWSCLVAVVLSAWHEHARLNEQSKLGLRVLAHRGEIELSDGDEPHFFAKYKVYETRWFAILSLIDRRNHRTLILNPDSFETAESYRRCRFQLRQLAGRHAA